MQILVVDDDPIIETVFKKSLSEHEILYFSTGEEAIKSLSENKLTEIPFGFIGVELPDIDFIHTIKIYINRIYIISSINQKQNPRIFDYGINGFLYKPLHSDVLQTIIKTKNGECTNLRFSSITDEWIFQSYKSDWCDIASERLKSLQEGLM